MAFIAPILGAVGAVGASGTFAALAGLSSVVSAVGSIAGGLAQQATLNAQAKQEQMKAKAQELQYRQQGVQVLEKTLAVAATVRARASAGSIDPFGGSAAAITNFAFGQGIEEKQMTEMNAQLAFLGGETTAASLRAQGSAAATAGFITAGTTLLSTGANIMKVGGVPSLTTPVAQPYGSTGFVSGYYKG
jgi:hypothetical protein